MLCGGRPGVILGINTVGLRRAGFSAAAREEIKQAYKLLYRSGLNVTQALEAIEQELSDEAVRHLANFIKESKRGICDGAESEDETLKARK
jgi:UDP-N-acetylglucosamine acyltransferase